MSVEVFHGNWKIIECVNISNSRSAPPAQIDGAVFTLQENGEIRWDLPEEVDQGFPLFQCDCYEVIHSFVGVSIQMGAVSGHMFEFWVDRPVPRDMMLLTFEGWCMIQCQQIIALHPPLDFPFSLLPALTDGYFSDLQVTDKSKNFHGNCSSNEKEFKVHSVIMEVSSGNSEDLKGLPSDVLATTLHFLYSQSLPSNLPRDTATRCIQLAPSGMMEFVQMCREYLHRSSLKQKIMKLVNEVHSCAEAMTAAFRENAVTNPSRFCHVIKLALRHAAVAIMKLVELCVLYGEEAPKLQRNERLEILRYAKTRLPIFLTQFVGLLRNIKSDFSTVKPAERNDIAAQVAPEIEILLEFLTTLMREAREACHEIWVSWSTASGNTTGSLPSCAFQIWHEFMPYTNPNGNPVMDESLTETLYSIFRKREVVKLHSIQGQIAAIYVYLAQKKENFEEMTSAVKVRCVARNLEQLLEELPVFLLRLEEIMIAFDDRFQWKDFKFCLQLAISQVCQTVHHLRKERERLQKFFTCLSDLIQRDEFHQSLVNLKLLDIHRTENEDVVQSAVVTNSYEETNKLLTESNTNTSPDDLMVVTDTGPGNKTGTTAASYSSAEETPQISRCIKKDSSEKDFLGTEELNLVENICTPKKSKESILARNAARLFNSSEFSDMVFEIPKDGDREILEIPSHRVLVAARCDWFRRALLSGMKESIQKRIVIHDCSAHVFELFLKYIYTGQTGESDSKTMDTLTDLISLADRYEMDSLKMTCEQELVIKHLDENSVIFLLSMADQFNARTLRGACMEYIAANPDIMARELFEELSPELQMEVYDITMWSKPSRKVFSATDELFSCPRYMLVPDSRSSTSSSTSSSSSSSSSPSPTHGHLNQDGEMDDSEKPIVASRKSSSHHRSHHHHRHSHHHMHRHHSHSHNSNGASSFGFGPLTEASGDAVASGTEPGHELNPEMERCLSQLREVLGDEVTVEQLNRIAITADFDVNRALNFYYG